MITNEFTRLGMNKRDIKKAIETGCKPKCFASGGHLASGITPEQLRYACTVWGRRFGEIEWEELKPKARQ